MVDRAPRLADQGLSWQTIRVLARWWRPVFRSVGSPFMPGVLVLFLLQAVVSNYERSVRASQGAGDRAGWSEVSMRGDVPDEVRARLADRLASLEVRLVNQPVEDGEALWRAPAGDLALDKRPEQWVPDAVIPAADWWARAREAEVSLGLSVPKVEGAHGGRWSARSFGSRAGQVSLSPYDHWSVGFALHLYLILGGAMWVVPEEQRRRIPIVRAFRGVSRLLELGLYLWWWVILMGVCMVFQPPWVDLSARVMLSGRFGVYGLACILVVLWGRLWSEPGVGPERRIPWAMGLHVLGLLGLGWMWWTLDAPEVSAWWLGTPVLGLFGILTQVWFAPAWAAGWLLWQAAIFGVVAGWVWRREAR